MFSSDDQPAGLRPQLLLILRVKTLPPEGAAIIHMCFGCMWQSLGGPAFTVEAFPALAAGIHGLEACGIVPVFKAILEKLALPLLSGRFFQPFAFVPSR